MIAEADKIQELQGSWEFRFQQSGWDLRALKLIDGHVETVETYEGKQLVHRLFVKLEAIEVERICTIKHGECTVTDGPNKGQERSPGSLISKHRGTK